MLSSMLAYAQPEITNPVPEPFDVSNAVYSQEFSMSLIETTPTGMAFNGDGTMLFVIGTSSESIAIFSLQSPYDISSATFNRNFWVKFQETNPRDLTFNDDGTMLYIIGYDNAAVIAYNLSSGYDLTTATYSKEFSIVNEESSPTDVLFNNDGSKFYVVGPQNNRVLEYQLTTSYDISTASYAGSAESLFVGDQENVPTGIAFNITGDKLFVIGQSSDAIIEYALSTPYDISTAVYAGIQEEFSVTKWESRSTDVVFNSDGSKAYIVDSRENRVITFDLKSELNTYSYFENETRAALNIDANDGAGGNNDESVTYGLRGTDALLFNMDVNGLITFKESPNYERPQDNDSDNIYQLNVVITSTSGSIVQAIRIKVEDVIDSPVFTSAGKGYDVSTAIYNQSVSVSSEEPVPYGMTFNPNGSKLFIVGYADKSVVEYELSTPFDISTLRHSGIFEEFTISQERFTSDIIFNSDGSRFYIVGSDDDAVVEYSLSTAFDVSTATYNGITEELSVISSETEVNSIHFNANGSKLFVLGEKNNSVIEYSLLLPYDISTAQYSGVEEEFSVVAQEPIAQDMTFHPDGTKMYIIGRNSDDVVQYDLDEAFDVSTARYSGPSKEFRVRSEEEHPRDIAFDQNGLRLFILGNNSNSVIEYRLATIIQSVEARSQTVLNVDANDGVGGKTDASVSYSLEGLDASFFSIDASGTITFNISTDFENPEDSDFDNTYSIYVVANNGIDQVKQHVLVHVINDIIFTNDEKEFEISFIEHTEDIVLDVNALENGAGTVDRNIEYSLEGNDASLFSVDELGLISFIKSPDFENPHDTDEDNTYEIQVIANNGTDQANQEILIHVLDDISFTNLSQDFKATFLENSSDVILDVNARENGSSTDDTNITYSLEGTDASWFGINAIGEISFNDHPNFEEPEDANGDNLYEFLVKAENTEDASSQPISVEVLDQNEVPLFTSVGEGFEVSKAVHAGTEEEFSVVEDDKQPRDLVFNADGTSMWFIGIDEDVVIQYELVTPFDISTSRKAEEFNVGQYEDLPTGLAFSTDGSKLFVVGTRNDEVISYALSTVFDISTASYLNAFSLSSEEQGPSSIAFNDDGTKMYITGTDGNEVNEYQLTTPFDITTSVHTSLLSVSAQERTPLGLTFSSDGSKMFVIGIFEKATIAYELSTAFDITTASYEGTSGKFSISSEELFPSGLAFNHNGTKMYVIGYNDDAVVEYHLPSMINVVENTTEVLDVDANNGLGGATDTSVTYSVEGADAGLFNIDVNGIISFNASPDFENPQDADTDNTYEISVVADNGLYTNAQRVLVYVQDAPVFSDGQLGYEIDYEENITLDVIDVDARDGENAADDTSVTYSLEGEDAEIFTINASGVISFKESPNYEYPLDADNNNDYHFEVVATGATEFSVQYIVVQVTNVEDTPVFIDDFGIGYDLEYAEGYTSLLTDIDANDGMEGAVDFSVEYSLVGDDAELFEIAIQGVIGFIAEPDFETPVDLNSDNLYEFFVVADNGIDTAMQKVTVAMIDVPIFNRDGTYQVNVEENNAGMILNIDAIAGWGEANDANITYSLSDGDASFFSIDESGFITPNQDFDYENPVDQNADNRYEFSVVATNDSEESVQPILVIVQDVNEFPLFTHVGKGFDLSTAEYRRSFYVYSGGESRPTGVVFHPTGLRMYIVGIDTDAIIEYSLERPFNVETASEYLRVSVAAQETDPRGLTFSPDGLQLYIVGNQQRAVHTYKMSKEYDISTAVYHNMLSVSSQDIYPLGIAFNTDGTKMFIMGNENDAVLTYELSTGYDVSTAVYLSSFSVGSEESTPTDVVFDPYGKKMFVVGQQGDAVLAYQLETAFDLRTASYISPELSVRSKETRPTGMYFNTSGTRLYMTGADKHNVNEYTLASVFEYEETSEEPVVDIDAISGLGGETDVDVNYLLEGTDGAFFSIDASGVIRFINRPDFENPIDADMDNTYELTVVASDTEDGSVNRATQQILIHVKEVDEAPYINSPLSLTVVENTTGVIYEIQTEDDESSVSITLGSSKDESIVSLENDNELFIVNALDFENPTDLDGNNEYLIDLIISDETENVTTEGLVIVVTDLEDEQAPSLTSSTSISVEENSTGVAYTITSDDESASYSLGSSKDESSFTLTNGNELSFIESPDYENPIDTDADNMYLLDITALDEFGNEATTEVIIIVTDVDDDPLSVEEVDKKITIYPNPTEDSFSLSGMESLKIESIYLVTLEGKTVREFQINERNQYYVSDLPDGTYLIYLHINGDREASGRLIKKNK